jgi:hypothetical protein
VTTRFPHHELRGSHREVGRQHGEALRPMIRAHLDLIYTQGSQKSQLAPEAARRWAPAQLWRLDAAAAIETSAPMPTPIDPR